MPGWCRDARGARPVLRVALGLSASLAALACQHAAPGTGHGVAAPPAQPVASAQPPAEPPIDGYSKNFFEPSALARLPAAERAAWQTYLARSAELRAADRRAMQVELAAEHESVMTRAPYDAGFKLQAYMTDDWLRSAPGRTYTTTLLSFQTPSGGWSKRVGYTAGPRRRGQSYYSENTGFHYIATIDNDSTTEQLRYLALAYAASPEPSTRAAFDRGVQFLLEAQYPNGCWPQVYPLQGGYHDAATYNDNAIVNVLRLLGDLADGKFPFEPDTVRAQAAHARERGLSCIVDSQFRYRGARTIWAQQHNPLTLEPVPARSYELSGLCGREGAWVAEYLMSLPSPDARVVEAVHAAAYWFKTHEIWGYRYQHHELTAEPGAGPLWARLYEIGSDRPIVANRNGIKLYDFAALTDRRRGYTWYSQDAARVLAAYPDWARAHPRTALPGDEAERAAELALTQGETLLVLEKWSETLSAYDADSGERRGRGMPIGSVPHEMVASADGQRLYISNYGVKTYLDREPGGSTLSVFDLERGSKTDEISLGNARRPHGIERGASGLLYVTSDFPPSVLVVDADKKQVRALPLDQRLPHMLALSRDEKTVYVANAGSASVSLVDTQARPGKKPRNVPVGGTPMGLALSDDERLLYVTTRDGNALAVIDTGQARLLKKIPLQGAPARVARVPNSSLLAVTLIEAGDLALIDTASDQVVARAHAGERAEGLFVDPRGRFASVAVQAENKVVEFTLPALTKKLEFATGERPDPMLLVAGRIGFSAPAPPPSP